MVQKLYGPKKYLNGQNDEEFCFLKSETILKLEEILKTCLGYIQGRRKIDNLGHIFIYSCSA